MIEIEPPKANGEQEIGEHYKLLTTNFQIEIECQIDQMLITNSTEQQMFES